MQPNQCCKFSRNIYTEYNTWTKLSRNFSNLGYIMKCSWATIKQNKFFMKTPESAKQKVILNLCPKLDWSLVLLRHSIVNQIRIQNNSECFLFDIPWLLVLKNYDYIRITKSWSSKFTFRHVLDFINPILNTNIISISSISSLPLEVH